MLSFSFVVFSEANSLISVAFSIVWFLYFWAAVLCALCLYIGRRNRTGEELYLYAFDEQLRSSARAAIVSTSIE
jgi:hypothetical protein